MPNVYVRKGRRIREPRPIGGGICELDLSMGLVALIDEADAHLVAVCSWCASYNGRNPIPYVKGRPGADRRFVRLHRYLMGFPADQVDHENGDTLDNRRCNLRVATQSQSTANTGIRKDNKTGFKGVTFERGLYVATCKGVRLGFFTTAIAAAKSYDAAALATFGTFARTNAALGLLEGAN
jgi:hypothetical protein